VRWRQQRPLVARGVRHRPLRPPLGEPLAQGRPRALQRALDRRDAQVQQPSGLARRPADHIAEDQHRALAGRQVLDRRHERELDRLALDHHGVRPLVLGRQQQPIRVGLEPCLLARRRHRLRVCGATS
jgi:hypothetical protein